MKKYNISKVLPKIVRIGAFDFKLEIWDLHSAACNRRYGECSTVELTIRLQEEFISKAKAIDTLTHEILHAIYWVYNLEDNDNEERTVGTIATALVAFYRDNPWYVKLLNL